MARRNSARRSCLKGVRGSGQPTSSDLPQFARSLTFGGARGGQKWKPRSLMFGQGDRGGVVMRSRLLKLSHLRSPRQRHSAKNIQRDISARDAPARPATAGAERKRLGLHRLAVGRDGAAAEESAGLTA
jgi:hypothetical protein